MFIQFIFIGDHNIVPEEPEETSEEVSRLCQKMSFDLTDMSASLDSQNANGSPFQRYTNIPNGVVTHYANLPKSTSLNLERRSESAREARQRFAERSPFTRIVHPPQYTNGNGQVSLNNIKHRLFDPIRGGSNMLGMKAHQMMATIFSGNHSHLAACPIFVKNC